MDAYFLNISGTAPSSGSTNYGSVDGLFLWSATEAQVSQVVPHALTASFGRIDMRTAPGGGKSWTFTLQKNGVDTAVVVAIAGTATSAIDNSNTAAFVAGDTISWKCVPSGTPSVTNYGFTGTLKQTAAGKYAVLFGGRATALTASTFYKPSGGVASTTETQVYVPIPHGGTVTNLFVKNDVDPTPGNWTLTLRSDNATTGTMADTTLTCNMAAGTTATSDTAHTATVLAGNLLSVKVTASASPSSSRISGGLSVLPTTDGDAAWLGGSVNNASNSTTSYGYVNGGISSLASSEVPGTPQAYLQACTIKGMYLKANGSPGGSTSYTVTLRNGADTTVTAAITGTNTTANITGQAVAVADGELYDWSVVPASTPTARPIHVGINYSLAGAVPGITVSPVASGTASKTFSFTSTTGTWSNSPTATSYQWQRDTAGNLSYSNISSQTSANYTATSSDLTCNVRCVITASNASGSASAASNALGPVGDQLAVVSSVGAEWCANATVVFSVGSPTSPDYNKQSTAAMVTGWSSWYV